MKITYKQIDHVQLCIPPGVDEEARQFYIDLLGFEEVPRPAVMQGKGGFWLQAGTIQLHIGVESPIVTTKKHPAFEIEDLDQVRAYLEQHHVKIKDHEAIPGAKRFSIYDPWENRIELVEKVD